MQIVCDYQFVIVAINILIAVASDFESAIRAWGTTWVSTEGVTLSKTPNDSRESRQKCSKEGIASHGGKQIRKS